MCHIYINSYKKKLKINLNNKIIYINMLIPIVIQNQKRGNIAPI